VTAQSANTSDRVSVPHSILQRHIGWESSKVRIHLLPFCLAAKPRHGHAVAVLGSGLPELNDVCTLRYFRLAVTGRSLGKSLFHCWVFQKSDILLQDEVVKSIMLMTWNVLNAAVREGGQDGRS
jgi:hypothetical protein